MRIAIATDDRTTVAAHTGRCAGFMIYDLDAGAAAFVEFRPNPNAARHSERREENGKHECSTGHSHDTIVEALAGCAALVTRGMGPRLINDLAAHGMQAHVCAAGPVEEAARLLAEGRLASANQGGTCRHK